MDWSKGCSRSVRLTEVDPVTWGDIREVPVTGGTIDRVPDGQLETADLTVGEPLRETWVRVWLEAVQGGAHESVPLFTGLATTGERTVDATRDGYKAVLSSALKVADDVLLPRGWYAPSGFPAAKLAARLLGVFGVRCFYMDGSPALSEAIVAEDDETNLSMAWRIVNSVGWTISVDGYGSVTVEPCQEAETAVIGVGGADTVQPSVTDAMDAYSAPNCLRVVKGDAVAEARDDNPESPLSTVARRREVWAVESNPELDASQSLAGYAQRRLRELQGVARTLKHKRRFEPDTRPNRVIRMSYPSRGLEGSFRITSQRIDLSNVSIDEEVIEC